MSALRAELANCPVCRAQTEIRRLVSTEGYVAIDLDYRVYTRGADPTRMLVARCGACGYAEYVTDFRQDVSSEVRDFVHSSEFKDLLASDRASDFPLIARIKEKKGEMLLRIVYAYVRASWFSGDLGRTGEERDHLQKAAECFEKLIAEMSPASQDQNATWSATAEKERTYYMLGEIRRRLGDFDLALKALDEVKDLDFSGLVRDQRNLIANKDTRRRRAKAR